MSQRVFPQLRITDWIASRRFYSDGLGFTVDWEHRFEPGLPVFAKLTREGMSIFLTEHSSDCKVGGAAYFVVADVDAFDKEIRGHGVEPLTRPDNTPWGTRELTVVDPDGNRLRFANAVTR
jgi:catechol 2,3-dioxygenase-like lactoylglutathione lyase family enzyme